MPEGAGLRSIQLSVGVQWKLAKQKADAHKPIWKELLREAAQGEVLNNDDTPITILQLLKDRLGSTATLRGRTAEKGRPR